MGEIRLIFVLSEDYNDPSEVSEIMSEAYATSKQHVRNVQWMKEEDIEPSNLVKTDCVIFEQFKGNAFDAIKTTKSARVLGPWCTSVCLLEGKRIPNFPWPIYNVAMYDCVICCSHIPKSEKKEIQEKVQLMGGLFVLNLTPSTTHLITDSVRSEKYIQASENDVKIVTAKWVQKVWEQSQKTNIHCTDDEFSKFKCPPFYNLVISSTGLLKPEKDILAANIRQHGGTLTATLSTTKTDMLIVQGLTGKSQKFLTARQKNIPCVSTKWVDDSIKKGYALSHTAYEVKNVCTSSPTRLEVSNPNFSMLSCINVNDNQTINGTLLSIMGSFANDDVSPPKRQKIDEVAELLEDLDMKEIKLAGQFLDGCSIFLAGFTLEQRGKLNKIINLSGATRYDDISDRLTHIIIGDATSPEVKIIKSKNYSFPLVTIHWLLNSIKHRMPVDEEDYLIKLNTSNNKDQFNSPSGQKGLRLLQSERTMTTSHLEAARKELSQSSLNLSTPEDDILQHYSQPNKDSEPDSLAQLLKGAGTEFFTTNQSPASTLTEINDGVFAKKTFLLMQLDLQYEGELRTQILENCGEVVENAFKGICDYIITPVCIKMSIKKSAIEVVNELWVYESIKENTLTDIVYYHRPMLIENENTLSNCVIAISNYTTYERNYLRDLVDGFGGLFQDQFSRIDRPDNNLYAATHLVCMDATGKKYEGAVKWGVPVVNKDWILECAKHGRIVEEDPFLVGKSKSKNLFVSGTFSGQTSHISNTTTPKSSPRVIKENTKIPETITLRERFKSVLTPSNSQTPLDITKTPGTARSKEQDNCCTPPINKRLENLKLLRRSKGSVDTQPCSQVTPISKIMEGVRITGLIDSPECTRIKSLLDTPDGFSGLTPVRKEMLKRFCDMNASFSPIQTPAKTSPSISSLSKQFFAMDQHGKSRCDNDEINYEIEEDVEMRDTSQGDDCRKLLDFSTPSKTDSIGVTDSCMQDMFMSRKMEELHEQVKTSVEKRRQSSNFKQVFPFDVDSSIGSHPIESQPLTVNWDYSDELPVPIPEKKVITRVFMISGLRDEIRRDLLKKVEDLGALVSDENASYDSRCTHLICLKPGRNEKTLGCIAAGKWILNVAYVDKSYEAGHFLNEEEFEFGNPRATKNINLPYDKENQQRMDSNYWWRCEITRRGYGAFKGMKAIVVAAKAKPIISVIEAGEGIAFEPKFLDASVELTHCLIEPKSVTDLKIYNNYAQQGVYCVNILYISDFLFRSVNDIQESILPHYSKFYKN